jgi:hypothetical protein
MKANEVDPVIDEIREARHRISARFGHDARRLVEHYLQKQDRHRDQPPGAKVAEQEAVGLTSGCSGPSAPAAEPHRQALPRVLMMLATELYTEQMKVWPKSGRCILAHYDDRSVIVYQAYRPSIGRYAVEHGKFGAEFNYSRMSWMKPNFLWMMYRSGWGTKENQEVTLALRLRRDFFESLLAQAVPSSWDRDLFATEVEWSQAVARSSVRLQWDPDHHPSGAKLERRAIQLGLRGEVLEAFGRHELLEVIDLSEFVATQLSRLSEGGVSALHTPRERVYVPADAAVAARLGLSVESID